MTLNFIYHVSIDHGYVTFSNLSNLTKKNVTKGNTWFPIQYITFYSKLFYMSEDTFVNAWKAKPF